MCIARLGSDTAHCNLGLRAHQARRLLRLSSHLGLANFLWTVHPVSSASGKHSRDSSRFSTRALWASLGGIDEGPLCTTQALMIQIGGYGTAVFSSVIAIHTFSVIVLQKTSPKSVAICVIVLGWTIPIGVDLMIIFTRPSAAPFYGLAQRWCWVRPITITFTSVRLLIVFLRFDRNIPCYGFYSITSRFSCQLSSLSSAIFYYSSSFGAIYTLMVEGSPCAAGGRDKWRITTTIGTCFPCLLTGCSGEWSAVVYDHEFTCTLRYPISTFLKVRLCFCS